MYDFNHDIVDESLIGTYTIKSSHVDYLHVIHEKKIDSNLRQE